MIIGLFFGSFNPIHTGHLVIAQAMLNHAAIDQIWFVVSPQNPFKKKQSLLGERERFYMVELATENHDRMRPSNIEFQLPQPSYTIDTLAVLSDKYKNYQFALIMGSDNLENFEKWKNYEQILENYSIFVYPRPGYEVTSQHPNIQSIPAPLMEISATYIRNLIKQQKSIQFLVPEKVQQYLANQHYYAD